MNAALRLTLAALLLLTLSAHASAAELLVAAASDLGGAAKEIIKGFEKKTGHTVKLSLGSSGNFHAQIANGAPFDVFLSADIGYVRDLEKLELTQAGTTFTYAIGRIVLWTPKNSSLDIRTLGMKSLLQPEVRRIAIANPEHAPYGRAAVAAMEKSGAYATVKSKLVLGENISQAAQFAQSGAADLGIIALSLAVAEPMKSQGKFWEIPVELYPPIEQGAVILKQAERAGHAAAARQFLQALRDPAGRAILERYGFSLPVTAGSRQ
jgi:molybdate transport system substrate-binding protein